jgi:hypothetical protein
MCKLCPPSKKKRRHKCIICGKLTEGKRYIMHGTTLYPLCDADITIYT